MMLSCQSMAICSDFQGTLILELYHVTEPPSLGVKGGVELEICEPNPSIICSFPGDV